MKTLERLSELSGKFMALIVLGVAALSLFLPSSTLWIQTSWINSLLMVVMFGMGLTIRPGDFAVVFTKPKEVLIGCSAQYIIMPLLAFLLSHLFRLDPALTAGVVLVGTCPGGTSSNVIVYGDSEDLSDRVGVITFNFSDVNSHLVAEELSTRYGIATRRGAFCANPYVWRLYGLSDEEVRNFAECSDVNTPGMIRVSFGIYNTEEEVDYLLKVLPKAIKQAKKTNKENFGLANPLY